MIEQFGRTWWGAQFLQALDKIDYSNRLPRGSSYARKGAVKQIKIEGNRIQAKVIGSRPTPYLVDIIIPPFFDPERAGFLSNLASNPILVSKLLNRELDSGILLLAEKQGLKVFPQQWTDFKMHCNCPDWAVPCKHLAAVIYKISAEIDNNPFLVFSLHQMDLVAEMQKLGLSINTKSVEIPLLSELYFDTTSKLKRAPYSPGKAYQRLAFSKLENCFESLLNLLSPRPVFYPGQADFKEKYSAILLKSQKISSRIIQGKISFKDAVYGSEVSSVILNGHSKNQCIIDEKWVASILINENEFSLPQFLLALSEINPSRLRDFQPSTAAMHALFQLSLQLLSNTAIVPQVIRTPNKEFRVRWLPAMIHKEVRFLVNQTIDMLPPGSFWLKSGARKKEINKDTALNLISLFLTELLRLFSEKPDSDLFLALFFKHLSHPFNLPGESSYPGGMQSWLQKYYLNQAKFRPQIVVSEQGQNFLVTVQVRNQQDSFGVPISLNRVLTASNFQADRIEILQTLAMLAEFIPGLVPHLENHASEPLLMESEQFAHFLLHLIPSIRMLDMDVLLPKNLSQVLKPKSTLKLKRVKSKTYLGLDKLLEFDWQIAIGEEVVSMEQFKKLLIKSKGLIKYKSNYFYVEDSELQKLLNYFNTPPELSGFQLLRAALSGEYQGAPVSLDSSVKALIKELGQSKKIPLPKGLQAQLRPYQHNGFSWLYKNAKVGFGSVIADDMGLGKTLQVITTLLKFKEEGLLEKQKVLVVAPTGLITNWLAEFEKFAPSMLASAYHGLDRQLDKNADVIVTSYGIVRQEFEQLKKKKWFALVIDEAQNIKNQGTSQTKAIKAIPANYFIAMSGTPVENRLSELWSIMDYSNRGLLGNAKEFQTEFAQPIETMNDLDVAEKLKRVTAPFLIRRLKSDKQIIQDLPDKIEMDSFSSLTPVQAGLYEKTVEEALNEINGVEQKDSRSLFVRQGLVLQMILALKQICNHPAQFLKNKQFDPTHSGKLLLLFDKLDSIIEAGEKVLIFTQFKEMGDMLSHFIKERYGDTPLFYHGGCSLVQRKVMVDGFQNNPADKVFILSLKAAGTGLNLTAANHVIHYDLWWNPAVEAQATDRAYRIGQKSNVMVHRFITRNTFEERINEMIQSKKKLAQLTVSSGENWIGNLSNTELKELFELNERV